MTNDQYDPLAAYKEPSLKEQIARLADLRLVFPLLLAAVVVFLYAHTLGNPLVFDDKPFFIESTLKQYGESVFFFDLRWFPYAAFGWTYDLAGLDWYWHRAGNVLLHIITVILIFEFFRRLFGAVFRPGTPSSAFSEKELQGFAFFGALFFALHPAAVYGVAYLVERSIVMATLFGVAMLFCFLEGVLERGNKWFVAAAVFYFLAAFSKEHSIMLPGAALALALLLRRPSLSLAKELWLPFALFAAIGLLVVLKSKGLLGSPYEPFAQEMLARLSENQHEFEVKNAYPLSVITQGFLFFKYLLLWVIPLPGWMSIDIRQPFAGHLLSWPETAGFAAFLVYGLVGARLLLKGGNIGLLGFGMLFPWILFLTELSTVRIQEPFVLYRSYLWMAGLPAALPLVLGPLAKQRWKIFLAGGFCLLLAILAWNRLDSFSSSLKLWNDVIAKNTNEKLLGVERGYNNRGVAYFEAGDFEAAMRDFNKALSLRPKYAEPYLNIGTVYLQLNKFEDAVQNFNRAIEYKPDYAKAFLNRGVVYLKAGQLARAVADFDRVIELDQSDAEVHSNKGVAYLRMGRHGDALESLARAIRMNPKSPQPYLNRGAVYAALGRREEGLADMNLAVQLAPRNAEAYYNRGNAYLMMGRHQEALADYDQAIKLDPRHASAHVNRGGVYMVSSRFPEALQDFDAALAINPRQENAYLNRGEVYAAQKRYQESLKEYEKVLEINPSNAKAHMNRGFLLLVMNRQQEAKASFRRSCELGNRMACGRL